MRLFRFNSIKLFQRELKSLLISLDSKKNQSLIEPKSIRIQIVSHLLVTHGDISYKRFSL